MLSIKGTSAGVFGGGGPTAKKDKLVITFIHCVCKYIAYEDHYTLQNDNLLFSCCCGYVDWSWTPVCGCHSGGWKCDISCVQKALVEESLFYPIGTASHFVFYENYSYLNRYFYVAHIESLL